jgi:hypothetical protein
MRMRVGDWVEIRSKEEILQTLDKKGQMQGLPFMPQMFQYCGHKFQVFKMAHKTCDWIYTQRSRWLPNGVHLDLRCNGEAYGGCQTSCLIYWKKAWLKPINSISIIKEMISEVKQTGNDQIYDKTNCMENDVWAGTHANNSLSDQEPIYVCQATEVNKFTTPIPWWDMRQFWEDYVSGNVNFSGLIKGFIFASYFRVISLGIGVGEPLRWLYDRFMGLWGGPPFPRTGGNVPVGQPTPTCDLNLKPGDLVRVKPNKEILATCNTAGRNRGLSFDAEMAPYCGSVFKVRTRVSKFVDEKTGKLSIMKNDSIILEGAWCRSKYSKCRMFCPRSIYPWWHEIWLERVNDSTQGLHEPTADRPI